MAVPPERWEELLGTLYFSEGARGDGDRPIVRRRVGCVEHGDQQVADLAMEFLHEGRPPVVREAVWPRRREASGPSSDARPRLHRCIAADPGLVERRASTGLSVSTITRCRAAA